jgi:hypothetical protein
MYKDAKDVKDAKEETKKTKKQKNFNYNFKKGGSSSNKPYVMEIKKFKENEYLINTNDRFKFNEKFSPLSGSELEYKPQLWNDDSNIKNSHNCYTYALGKIVKGLNSKAQPGYASGFDHIEDQDYDCKSFRERLKKDSPGSYLEKHDNSCLPGFYKVFLALDPKNDYHWYRQDKSKFWSHKPGSTDVINIDASGEKISNPLVANRKYSSLDYYKPCFFACIYSDLARSIDSIYS